MGFGELRHSIWLRFAKLKKWYLTAFYDADIHSSARISWGAVIDKSKNIHIGAESYVASGVKILAHDFCRAISLNTTVGERCFIGINAIILPGVTIGDEVIVGAGSVVTKDVPSNCIVAGNPAKVIRSDIHCRRYGQLIKSTNEQTS